MVDSNITFFFNTSTASMEDYIVLNIFARENDGCHFNNMIFRK